MNHLPYKAYDLVILITHLSYNKFHSDRSRYKALSNCFFFFFFFFMDVELFLSGQMQSLIFMGLSTWYFKLQMSQLF
jgi:hypothetical protein